MLIVRSLEDARNTDIMYISHSLRVVDREDRKAWWVRRRRVGRSPESLVRAEGAGDAVHAPWATGRRLPWPTGRSFPLCSPGWYHLGAHWRHFSVLRSPVNLNIVDNLNGVNYKHLGVYGLRVIKGYTRVSNGHPGYMTQMTRVE